MRALLDINVLLALLDSAHQDHDRARQWFTAEVGHGWASCAITQNGFLRIRSQPNYPHGVSRPRDALEALAAAVSTVHHEYWDCSISLCTPELIDPSRLLGPRQVTDVYLLALATARDGRFVTLDRRVRLDAVPTATSANLVVM